MEKGLCLRVVHRLVMLPTSLQAPTIVHVNCWRLTMLYSTGFLPIIDGVNLLFLGNGAGGDQPRIVYGGAYDRDGLPVYINQKFTLRATVPIANGGVVFVEEYLDHDARQNR